VLALASWSGAITIRPGLWYGPQKIQDAKIRSVYGEQSIYLPYLEVQVWKGLMAGGGYEFGLGRIATAKRPRNDNMRQKN